MFNTWKSSSLYLEIHFDNYCHIQCLEIVEIILKNSKYLENRNRKFKLSELMFKIQILSYPGSSAK